MMHQYIVDRKMSPDNARMHNSTKDPREIIRAVMALRAIGSERELAERASIDQSAFNRYMRSETAWLSTRTLQALATCLQVTSSQLLGEVPLDADPKAAAVLREMEKLPENLKDVLVATSKSLADSNNSGKGKPQ